MNKVRQLLEESLTGGLYQMTLSGATGEATGCSKKKIRPVLLKDRLLFQITAYRGTQVFHENHTAEEAAAILEADLSGSFKQLQIETTSFEATVLVSKKGKMTVRKKQRSVSEDNVRNCREIICIFLESMLIYVMNEFSDSGGHFHGT